MIFSLGYIANKCKKNSNDDSLTKQWITILVAILGTQPRFQILMGISLALSFRHLTWYYMRINNIRPLFTVCKSIQPHIQTVSGIQHVKVDIPTFCGSHGFAVFYQSC